MADSTVEKIKERIDVVELVGSYIKLEKAGINFRAPCPFHREKKPSFFVSPARQMFKCFGCGAGGDIFGFVMQIEGVEFRDALRTLASRAGVELPVYNIKEKTERERQEEICELATKFFERQLDSEKGEEVKKYLKKRGLTLEAIKKWRLGYSPDLWQGLSDFLVGKGYNRVEAVRAGLAIESEKGKDPFDRFRGRIMFPIFDLNSKVVGFGGRILEGSADTAKYMNTPNTLLYDKSRIVYGLNFAKVDIRKNNFSVLTEGYMDVILSQGAGALNTIASSGTSLTFGQLQIIKRYSSRIYTAFDMDSAGGAATEKSIALAEGLDFEVKVILMPQGKDPADVASEDPKKWKELIEGAKDIFDFYFENALSKFDKNTPEGKKEISKALLPKIRNIPNKIVRAHWVQKLAAALKVSEDAVWEELKKISPVLKEFSASSVLPASVPRPQSEKNRRKLLEELALSLILKDHSKINEIKGEELEFFSPESRIILKELEQNISKQKEIGLEKLDKIFEKISKDNAKIKEILDSAFFVGEVGDFGKEAGEISEELEKEFGLCLLELKKIHFKEKIGEASRQIRSAEIEGDEKKLEKLSAEFSELAKKLCF